MTEHYSFSLWQDGIKVAGVYTSDYTAGEREIRHYAMVYGQDGLVKIRWPRNRCR